MAIEKLKSGHYRFPSPLGIFFISLLLEPLLPEESQGFRPLWGSLLFLLERMKPKEIFADKFPSPMGFFFISIMITGRKASGVYEFPSPMGIFFISIKNSKCFGLAYDGFRPLWGSFLFLFG